MVAQEDLPALQGRSTRRPCTWRRSTRQPRPPASTTHPGSLVLPQRVLAVHMPDQRSEFVIDLSSAAAPTRAPAPVGSENAAVPGITVSGLTTAIAFRIEGKNPCRQTGAAVRGLGA
jgi:hypothetical protein